MTGKLQNDIPHKFFLTRYWPAFHAVYQHFLSCRKWFITIERLQKRECEYHEKYFSLPRPLHSKSPHINPIFFNNCHQMLNDLRKKWKVSKTDLFLILCVFAITGTTTAYLSKVIPGWIGFSDATHWGCKLFLRLVILIFGYQIILLTVAFLFGQFPFFWQFEKKMLRRLGLLSKEKPVEEVEINERR